jgi:hypothetical protein
MQTKDGTLFHENMFQRFFSFYFVALLTDSFFLFPCDREPWLILSDADTSPELPQINSTKQQHLIWTHKAIHL